MKSIFDTDSDRGLGNITNDRLVAAICAIPMEDRNAEAMARAAYATLQTLATESGMTASREVFLKAPGEPRHFPDDTCWCVAWEAGPYQWAHGASMAITCEAGKLCEPYYSFDLCFYPSEDAA